MTTEQQSESPAKKRKLAPNEARVPKHRSSQACQACRNRKVRCDVLKTQGNTCTNCRLDNLECIVLASRRGKNNVRRREGSSISGNSNDQAIPKPLKPRESLDGNKLTPIAENANYRREDHATPSSPTGQNGNDDVPLCVTFDDDQDAADDDQGPMSGGGPRTNSFSADHPSLPSPEVTASKHHQSPPGTVPLPSFFTPLAPHILTDGPGLEFLIQRGAFAVPEPDLRAEILRNYIFTIHPFMPMLDIKVFIHAALEERDDSQISPLLFQAVMFAGLCSLQLHWVHRLGYESTKQAREVFFNRTRLLYEFDVEPDNAAVLQSLLLMSSWYSRWNERRDTWHWTGQALFVGQTMGLHREPTRRSGNDKVQRFRRRLWWSLYIRDRLIGLGTRRPMRIRDDEFDVAMLTLEDFDLGSLDEFKNGQPLIVDATENKTTALMCIELAKLSVLIGNVLSARYTTLTRRPNVPHTTMVVPNRDSERMDELDRCDKDINEWLHALGTNVPKINNGSSQKHSCSEVHWSILNMIHLTLVSVLHRTQALQTPLSDHGNQLASRTKVKESSRTVTRLAHNMLRRDQARFLSLSGITALLSACLSHIQDIRSGDEDVRDASIFRLGQSMQVLQYLRGVYETADAAVSFLTSVVQKSGVTVDMGGSFFTVPASSTNGSLSAPPVSYDQNTANQSGNGWSSWNDNAASSQNPQEKRLVAPHEHALIDDVAHTGWQTDNSQRTFQQMNAHATPVTYDMLGYATPNTTGNGMGYVNPASRPFPNSASNDPFLGWSNGLEDLEPNSFHYELCLDAFGFFDGQLEGM